MNVKRWKTWLFQPSRWIANTFRLLWFGASCRVVVTVVTVAGGGVVVVCLWAFLWGRFGFGL